MLLCEQNPNATCCKPYHNVTNVTALADDRDCPLKNCQEVIESHLHQAVKIVGCLGLIFSFTEVGYPHGSISDYSSFSYFF